VLTNDENLGDGYLVLSIDTDPSNGDAQVTGDSSVAYSPDPDFYGSDSFTYEVCDEDSTGECDNATVSVSIASVDDEPDAVNDNVTIDEDSDTTMNVLDNDTGLGDGGINVTIATDVSHGDIQVNPDNTITYVPDDNYNGDDEFSYQVSDGDDDSDIAVVDLTIEPVNDIPVANDDSLSTLEDTEVTVDVLANDEGLGDGDITVTEGDSPSDGSIMVNGDNTITYTPNTGFIGSDSFTYEVCDEGGAGECRFATVKITVDNTDDTPIANDDIASLDEDTETTIDVLSNDQDLNDGGISVSITNQPSHGSVNVNPDNTVDYSPNDDYAGTDSLVYQVCDVNDDCDTATVSITVNEINDEPIANDDEFSTQEDTPGSYDVLSNDVGLGDGGLNVTIAVSPVNGSITNVNTDSITYLPDQDYYGSDSLSYSVCDVNDDCDTAIVTVNVTSQNDQPVANSDDLTLDEDTEDTVNVLDNDSGLGDGGIVVTVDKGPDHGSFGVTKDNRVIYTPANDYNGQDTIIYKVCDGDNNCDTSRIFITVAPVNDEPIANVDYLTLTEDTRDTIDVLSNDENMGDGGISVSIDKEPNHGNVDTTDNQIVYEPYKDYNGPDTLIYDLCDGTPDCDTSKVIITVENEDDRPVAIDDVAEIKEDSDTTINVLANDDGLGDGIADLVILKEASHGTLNVNVADSTIEYIPNENYNGTDEFDYRVTDSDGDYDNATVTITVQKVNDEPVAVDDAVTISEDSDSLINVVANDKGLGDGLSNLEIESVPGHGNARVVGDSTIEYTPDKDYNGNDQFDYRITDKNDDYDIATVSVSISPQNDSPVAVNDTFATDEDKEIAFNVLNNDLGLGDGGLSIQITSGPEIGTGVVTGDSTIKYTPDYDLYGQDSLTYEVSDTNNETASAKVYITVHPVDDYHPVAKNDERGMVKNTTLEVDVLFNDLGLGDGNINLLIDNTYEPNHGNASVTADNKIEYTPETDYLGDDSLVYQVYDEDNDISSAKVLIHVKENNVVPIANDDNASTHKNTQLFIDVLSNDSNLDDGGIKVTEWIEPSNGEIVAIDSNYLQYLPDKGFYGNDRLVYRVSDAEGDYDTASVYITVTNDDNILPKANTDSATTQEDTEVTHDVLSNDNNLDDGIYKLNITDDPENGSVTDIEIAGSQGNITYKPKTDYYGLDSMEYQVCDLNNDCDRAKMIIDVQPVDDHHPVAFDDSSGTSLNTPVTVHVLMNDTALNDGGINITEFNSPANGNITDINNAKGTVTYEPATDYTGYDNFEYQITDYDGDKDEANVKINVRENNSVPVANADTAETSSGTTVEIDVLANDIAGDGGMENMKVTKFTEPKNGSITVTNGSLVEYTPDVDFSKGLDTFYYKVDDVDGDWDTARVSVIVYDGYNHRPNAFDDYRLIEEDASELSIDVLENDTALQDAPIHLSIQEQPRNGEITNISGDSAITYKPTQDYFGQDSLAYKISDINGDWDVAKVYFQILPVDDGIPDAKDDSTGTSQNTPVTIDVLMNDDNIKDSIELSKISDPTNGSITVHDSSITYTPAKDYLGRDDFEYQISDHDGQSDQARVIIEVRKDNIVPVAFPDSSQTTMNNEVSIHVLHNDTLLDDGVGKVTIFNKPSNGNALVKTDNTVEYQPAEDYIGTDRLVYKVDDIDGDWDTAFVKVQVDSVPDYMPEAKDDYRATQKNTAVDVNVLDNDSGLGDTPLNVWIIEAPEHGDALVDEDSHVLTYQPETDFLGKDTLQYAVFDKQDDSDTASVIINVKDNNLIPLAIDDSAHTLMNHDVAIHVLNNDSLLQDGVKGVSVFSEPEHGEVKVNQYNAIIYEPYKWYTGSDEFEYRVEDADGDVDIASVYVTVEEIPNYIPEAKDDSTGTSMNQSVTLDVLRNDEGLKNGPITLRMESNPSNGQVTINSDNTATYTPDNDYKGYDSFNYRVCDYDDECDVATVTVHVRENNTVPVAMNDKVYTHMNEAITVEVLENDSGLDDGIGNITIPGKPFYGTAVVNSDYTITYTPNYWFEGPDTLTYELSDVDGDYDTAHVAIGVLNSTDSLPGVSITDISGNTTENGERAYFDVALKTQPSSDVVINISSTDTTEGLIEERKLIFTPDNFDREQDVYLEGIDDNIVDGDIPYRALTENAVSEDSVYNLLTVSNVDIVNEDNDKPGIEVTLLSENNRTTEGGEKVEVGFELVTQPTAEVLVNISSTDETEGILDNNQLIFTPFDSTLTRKIVVTGVDDQEHDGDIDYALKFNTSSEDTSYNDVNIEDFELVNEDNDEIGTFIPDAFSPNGDNLNERFIIKGIDQYDNLSIKIYNRWGSLVYSNNDYQNNWNGKANVTTLGTKKLSSGTYYYYLKIKDTGETIEGSVYLKR
jgi:gliding motility-associated-like protein